MSELIENANDQQYSEITNGYSGFDLTSNGSRIQKEILFNQTVDISKKSPSRKQ